MDGRLTKIAWLDFGLTILAESGADAIKVLPLAKGLNVSRGSFYWHFSDIDEYRSELLNRWGQVAAERVIVGLDAEGGNDRLKLLIARAFVKDDSLERAIRSWASHDKIAADLVAKVDTRRIEYISHLLSNAGLDDERANGRATFVYWAYLGQYATSTNPKVSIPSEIMDEISGLLER